ncbi:MULTISPECIES: phage portal protein [Haloarcula]|uniref:phage portal protein n=1 Tax=Haloarcula TaxID=2237 RepID=UPI000F8C54F0|nr:MULTISPECIES: phage portal protein [Haloarcula]NHX41398.1 phage portal protein [Haloarcula sp. R1-2]
MDFSNTFGNLREAVLGDGTPDTINEDRHGGYGPYRDSREIDTITPDDEDLEKFWDQYQVCALVRVPIRMYGEDITEPGHRIEADSDELEDDMEEWLDECAIINGEADHSITELWDSCITQKEVRGTALVEIVPKLNNSDEMWGFRMINASTVNAYTYDNKAVLIRPDDIDQEDAVTTPRGEAAAYGQWDNDAIAGPFDSRKTIFLSQNDVLKMVQDGDTGDIFGTSSVAPVSSEIDELRQMLDDLSSAVHSKGYPHWIFKLGEPNGDVSDPRAGIWPDEEMKNYQMSHKEGNWSTGQKDFVPGDVDVETISSDVPEIEQLLDWYVEQIISAMPTPKYKIGHADSVNRDITKTQQEQYERKVKGERRRLEDMFEPTIKRKAREMGYGEAAVESIELKIQESTEENPLERDDFDADDFTSFAQGIERISGGNPQEVVAPEEAREMLGLPTDDGSPDAEGGGNADENGSEATEAALESEMGELSEDDEQVIEQFKETYGEPAVPDGGSEHTDD